VEALGHGQRLLRPILTNLDARLPVAVPLSFIAARISSVDAEQPEENSGAAPFTTFVKGARFSPSRTGTLACAVFAIAGESKSAQARVPVLQKA